MHVGKLSKISPNSAKENNNNNKKPIKIPIHK